MTTENEKSAEQIASENNLDMAIQEEPTEQAGENQQSENQQAGESAETGLYGLLSIVPLGLGLAGLKNTAAVWSDDVIRQISAAAVPVLRKYTFGQKIITFLETGGGTEEFILLMSLAPVTLATVSAYKLDTKPVEKEVKGEEVQTEGKQSAETPLNSTFEFRD